MMNIYIGLYDA